MGVTDSDPTVQPPTAGNYAVCAYHEGILPAGPAEAIKCAPSVCGRYVVIQLSEPGYLTLCEVQVFPVTLTGTVLYLKNDM